MEFDEFAVREHPRLVAALTLFCGDRWVAEEFAQDALVRARERWDQVATMDAPGAWVHRVAINLATSGFRRRRAERRAYRKHAGSLPTEESGPSADALVVRDAVVSLPARQRTAVICRYFLELSVRETAQVMGVTSGSVKSVTHRAMVNLRQQLDVEVNDPEEAHDVP